MTGESAPGSGTPARLVGIGSAIGIMVAAILVLAPVVMRSGEAPPEPAAAVVEASGEPIAAEAAVFRRRTAEVAIPPDAPRRGDAHPRTLAMYRSIRAFPGAPPRIPHGLTAEEYRSTGCNPCHERGGYVGRFSSYVPVTPHPGYTDCLQCHLPDDVLVGVRFPDPRRNALCLQCHVPDAPAPEYVPLDWEPPAWPETDRRALPGAPPAVPHDFQLRGDCLACHMGPAGVEEIRTDHPERANCRQCHVPALTEEDAFTRPLQGSAPTTAGGS